MVLPLNALLGAVLISGCAENKTMILSPSEKMMLNIIPKPLETEVHEGYFKLTSRTEINDLSGDPAGPVAKDLSRWIRTLGLSEDSDLGEGSLTEIILKLDKASDRFHEEGYQIEIIPRKITISAVTQHGLSNGVQTLKQLTSYPAGSGSFAAGTKDVTFPCLTINDKPRFAYRGFMLDVSRHFFPKEFILELLDFLTLHKINTFHWHLCDDQGWRLEIKKYPRLTEIGAWRVDRENLPWNARPPQNAGESATYGGFYTQEDVREIVAYAQSRFITLIPEIEMPGHTLAALAAYPQYSCTGGPYTVPPGSYWPISDVYCAGNDSTFLFLQDILDEVIALFPGKYIHIGGDEVEKSNWRTCPKCQQRMTNENLRAVEELQSYFIHRMEAYLNGKGRTLIGWDEILEGGLAPNATVMSWRGFEGGIKAARSGHDVIMTPIGHCYFNLYQGDPEQEPLAYTGFIPLKKVYEFEPVPDSLNQEEARHVLGGQANLWSEYIPDPSTARYLIYPRLAALSEALWTDEKLRSWSEFDRRLPAYFKFMNHLGVQPAKSVYQVRLNGVFNIDSRRFSSTLETESALPEIRYSLDGTDPTTQSTLYQQQLKFSATTNVKAAAFVHGEQVSAVLNKRLIIHKASAKKIQLVHPYSERYSGGGEQGLVNSMFGSRLYSDGRWQGFEKVDLDGTIDLGAMETVHSISCTFLEHTGARIFRPVRIEYAVSEDGISFQNVFTQDINPPVYHREAHIEQYTADFKPCPARFIRIQAFNAGECPSWHFYAGGKAFLFIDEIVVE